MKNIMKTLWRKITWVFRSKYRFLSLIFIALLVLPTATFPLLKDILPSEINGLIENRNLSEFEISFQNFGSNFETFYQDNFPYRNSLIPLYNKYYNIIYNAYFARNTEDFNEWEAGEEFRESEWLILEQLVKDEGFIFEQLIKDEELIADQPEKNEVINIGQPARNDARAEIDLFKRLLDVLVEADDYFKALNKQIIFQVCPRKRNIINRVTSVTEMDLIVSYINSNSSVSFSYPKNEYLEASSRYMTFDEYNGHHNFLGAYVSWQDIQRKAGIATTDLSGIEISEFQVDIRRIITTPYNISCCYTYNQDLPAIRKTEHIISTNYNVAYMPDIEIETLHNSGCYHLEFKSSNKNGLTLFLTGDSFFETQIQYAIKDFEFSNISHLYNFDAGSRNRVYRERIKRYIESADVIVIVIGENNLWHNDLEHNPGIEHRLSLIMELAREIYK
ncbi:MAG: hypothetical protein FWC21_02975 [Treponema sp.]|nr:hypothetical protein [Treponema sp.]